MIALAYLTLSNTTGFPLLSLYAPILRLTLALLVFFLKASATPKIGSGGPIGTPFHTEKEAALLVAS